MILSNPSYLERIIKDQQLGVGCEVTIEFRLAVRNAYTGIADRILFFKYIQIIQHQKRGDGFLHEKPEICLGEGFDFSHGDYQVVGAQLLVTPDSISVNRTERTSIKTYSNVHNINTLTHYLNRAS